MKMLNDDTTQILLAIVFGIVICWFIFGRNGSCSLSGNNGFSVGGPIDIRSLDLECKRALDYLDISFETRDPEKQGDYRLRTIGNPGNPNYWDQEIGNERCDLANINTAEDETCCFGTGTGEQDDVTYLDSGEQARPMRFRPPNTMGALLSFCPQDLQNTIDSYIAACNSNFPLGDEDIAGGLQCDEDSDCTGVAPGHNMPNSRCEITQTTPWVGGTCVEESQEESQGESCPICDDELGYKINCTAGSAGECNTPDDIILKRAQNVANSMITMLLKLTVHNRRDTTTLDEMEPFAQDLDSIGEMINTIIEKALDYDLHFIVFENVGLTKSGQRLTQLSPEHISRNLQRFVTQCSFQPGNIGVDVEATFEQPVSTCNLYDSLSRLPLAIQTSLYCQGNTLNLEEGRAYDPLLKVRTTDMESNGVRQTVGCPSEIKFEADTTITPARTLEKYATRLNENSKNTDLGTRLYTNQRLDSYTNQGLFNTTTTGRHNNKMLLVESRPTNEESVNSLTIELEVTGDYEYLLGTQDLTRVTVPTGTYKLLFTDGMSENGTPYDELFGEVKTMFDNFRSMGVSTVFNNMGHFHIVQWYLSLYVIQYYILKVLLDTGKTFRDAFGQDIDFVENISTEARGEVTQERSEPLVEESNTLCIQSSKDYYVMGLVQKGGTNHGEVSITEEVLAQADYTSLAETVGLSIGPGQDAEQKYTLAKVNEVSYRSCSVGDVRRQLDNWRGTVSSDCNELLDDKEERSEPFEHNEYCELECDLDDNTIVDTSGRLCTVSICGESNNASCTTKTECEEKNGTWGAAQEGDEAEQSPMLKLICNDGTVEPDLEEELQCKQKCFFDIPDNTEATGCPETDNDDDGYLNVRYDYKLEDSESCNLTCEPDYSGSTLSGLEVGEPHRVVCNPDGDNPGDADLDDFTCCPNTDCDEGEVQIGQIIDGVPCDCVDSDLLEEAIFGRARLGKAVLAAAIAYCISDENQEEGSVQYDNCIDHFIQNIEAEQCSSKLNTMNTLCCNEEGEDCSNGYPTTCNTDCKDAFEEFYTQCRTIEPYSSDEVADILDSTMRICGTSGQTVAAQQPPEPETPLDNPLNAYWPYLSRQGPSRREDLPLVLDTARPPEFGTPLEEGEGGLHMPELRTSRNPCNIAANEYSTTSEADHPMCNIPYTLSQMASPDRQNTGINSDLEGETGILKSYIKGNYMGIARDLREQGYEDTYTFKDICPNTCRESGELLPIPQPPEPEPPALTPTDNQIVLSDLHDSRKVCDMACQTYGGEFSRFPMCNVPYQLYYIAGHADYDDSPYVDGPISSQEREYYNQHYRGIAREIIQSDRQLSWSRFSDICPATCSNSLSNPNCP